MLKRLLVALAVLLALIVAAIGATAFLLWRTVPPAAERRAVAGLARPASIAFDSSGVPTLYADSEIDLAFLQGWVHARDRRFQIEMQRRTAAGRLAEVVGRGALANDRRFRTFGFVPIADSALARMSLARRALYQAYAAGVNAFDDDHPAPPEFAALGIPREPWQARDCLLSVLLMFEQLNSTGEPEREIEAMDAHLPPALVAFLLPESTPGDVALDGRPAPPPPALPSPDEVNLRGAPAGAGAFAPRPERDALALLASEDAAATGSNNWAIAASRSATGSAILAGDPHLGLRVPVIWYRLRLQGAGLHVTGITLPGAPGVVMGTNGDVAWAMTNVEPDAADLVRVTYAAGDTTRYLVPGGAEPFRLRREWITVKGAPAETMLVRSTRWGPVIGRSARGGPLALQWVALDPRNASFDLLDLDRARSVREFARAVGTYRGPAQNFVFADRAGKIGWAIGGPVPRRRGFDPRRPRDGTTPNAGWFGWVPADSLPRVLDPPAGFLTTANQRTVGGAPLELVTGTGFAMPYRAKRVSDVVSARTDWDAPATAALQNDVDDGFLAVPAAALDRALTPEACAAEDTLARVRALLDGWTHRADTTSAAHFYLRMLRVELNNACWGPLVAQCVAADSGFAYTWPIGDEVTRRLLEERPLHLLDPRFDDWDELVRDAAKRAARAVARSVRGVPFDRAEWGRFNRAAIHHPLGDAVPQLGPWLNMPDAALAGGSFVVRVARSRSGASMRMVVDLAHPERSRFATPGGQSGNFLSKHYGDQFDEWVAGTTQPLEPGPAVSRVALRPATR